ncbi:hypothetical protein ROHU_021570 [Labeo rohita]|uniref:Uncharacterized protein n=1 Tax=Labeo rohita TaxID=84645 RepID=A0A498N9D9_LABRO|nr:hypothetical protein ROHU_021570 [Labeo rohita]
MDPLRLEDRQGGLWIGPLVIVMPVGSVGVIVIYVGTVPICRETRGGGHRGPNARPLSSEVYKIGPGMKIGTWSTDVVVGPEAVALSKQDEEENGLERVIAYASRALTKEEHTSAPTVLPQVGAEPQHYSEVPLGASWVHRRPPEVSPNLQKEVSVLAGHRQQAVQEPELQEEDQDGLKEGSEVALLKSKAQRPVRERRRPAWAQDYEMAPV